MLATVKIIPFAVPGDIFLSAMKTAHQAKPLVRVAPYKIKKVGVVSTLLPGLSPKVIDKTLKITDDRLDPAGARIIAERRVPHDQAALAKAIREVENEGAELVIVFGASAIADRRDVIPPPIEAVGGTIEHFGMPVDPGNLMLIGTAQWPSGARRAGLRALAEGKRFRLGVDAPARRTSGDARRHHRHGRRRAADGNRHAAAAARRASDRQDRTLRRGDPRGGTLDPNGWPQQADGGNHRQAAGADRGRGGAQIAGAVGRRRDRPSKRNHHRSAEGSSGPVRA